MEQDLFFLTVFCLENENIIGCISKQKKSDKFEFIRLFLFLMLVKLAILFKYCF